LEVDSVEKICDGKPWPWTWAESVQPIRSLLLFCTEQIVATRDIVPGVEEIRSVFKQSNRFSSHKAGESKGPSLLIPIY
jgi:hypothetical protein